MRSATRLRRGGCVALLLAGGFAAAPVRAEPERNIDPTKISCPDFLALEEPLRARVVAWLDGFVKASRLKPEEIGDTVLWRPVDPLVAVCESDPTQTLAAVFVRHYHGSTSPVAPMAVRCARLLELKPRQRDELVAWIEGYWLSKESMQGRAVPRFDLARDGSRVAARCRARQTQTVARVMEVKR